jgi:hypothetical protein
LDGMTLEAARTPHVAAGFSATDTRKEQIAGGQLGTPDGRGWGEVEYGWTTPTMATGGCTYAIVDVVLRCFYSSRRRGRTRSRDSIGGEMTSRRWGIAGEEADRQGWTRANSVQARSEPAKSSFPSGRAWLGSMLRRAAKRSSARASHKLGVARCSSRAWPW